MVVGTICHKSFPSFQRKRPNTLVKAWSEPVKMRAQKNTWWENGQKSKKVISRLFWHVVQGVKALERMSLLVKFPLKRSPWKFLTNKLLPHEMEQCYSWQLSKPEPCMKDVKKKGHRSASPRGIPLPSPVVLLCPGCLKDWHSELTSNTNCYGQPSW